MFDIRKYNKLSLLNFLVQIQRMYFFKDNLNFISISFESANKETLLDNVNKATIITHFKISCQQMYASSPTCN